MEADRLLPSAVLLLFKPKYRVSWVVERTILISGQRLSRPEKKLCGLREATTGNTSAFTGYLLPPKSRHSGLRDLPLCPSLSNVYCLPTVVISPSSWCTLLESFQTISRLFHTLIVFVFLLSQAHGVHTEGEVVYVPFPLDCKYGEGRKYMWIIINNAVIEDKEFAQFY